MKNSFAAAAALDKHCIAANAVNCVRHLFGGALKALVAVAALALAGPAQSAPVIHEVVDGIEWTYYIVNGSAVIFNNDDSVIPKSTSGAITVPSTIGGYTVTGIGRDAFFECDKLTSVTVPDTVTSVDGYAFYRCTNLKTVELPLTVTHVGSGIFDFCTLASRGAAPGSRRLVLLLR